MKKRKVHQIVYLVFGTINMNIGTKYLQPYYCKNCKCEFQHQLSTIVIFIYDI